MSAWLPGNSATKLRQDDGMMMGTPVVEHGKQRWWTVNGTRTIERTFYQRFWFQRRQSGTAKSLIHKWRRHQSFDPRYTLPRTSRGSARHVFLVKIEYFNKKLKVFKGKYEGGIWNFQRGWGGGGGRVGDRT